MKWLIILIIGMMTMINIVTATITLDKSYTQYDQTTNLNITTVIPDNGKLVVIGIISTTTGGAITTNPTYNGITMTRVGTSMGDTAGEGTSDMFYMINPPTGTGYLYITEATGNTNFAYAISVWNVSTGNTITYITSNQTSTTAANPTLGLATLTGDLGIATLFTGATAPPTVYSGTAILRQDTGAESAMQVYNISTGTALRFNSTLTSDDLQYIAGTWRETVPVPLPLPMYFWNGESLDSTGASMTLTNYNNTRIGDLLDGEYVYNMTESSPQFIYNSTGISWINRTLGNWALASCFQFTPFSFTDTIFASRTGASDYIASDIATSGTLIRAGYRNAAGTGWTGGVSSIALQNNTWYCIIYNGYVDNIDMYINGTNQTGTTTPNLMNTDGLAFGAYLNGAASSYVGNGKYAYFAIYNQTLEPYQIANITNEWISYDPYATESDPCTYSGSGDFNISNAFCTINSTYNLLGNKFYIYNGTINITTEPINFSIRQYYGSSNVVRRT